MASATNVGATSVSGPSCSGAGEGSISQKTKGASDGKGEDFEIHMTTLVFLRLINADADFFIDSNVAAAGSFDDIVLRYRIPPRSLWRSTLIQLKHKKNVSLTIKDFISISKDADFSLLKYGKSYQDLKDGNVSNLLKTSFEDIQFVLFTNAKIGKVMETEQGHKKYSQPKTSNVTVTENKGDIKSRDASKLAELSAQLCDLRKKVVSSDYPTKHLIMEEMLLLLGFNHKEENLCKNSLKTVDKLLGNLELRRLIDTGGKSVTLEKHQVILDSLGEWIDLKENLARLEREAESENDKDAKLRESIMTLEKYQSHIVNAFKTSLTTAKELKTEILKLEKVGEMRLYKEFLKKLRVYTNQARLENILALIKDELKKAIGVSEDDVVNKLVMEVKNLWREKQCLEKESEFWKALIISEISKQSHEEPNCFTVEFEKVHLETCRKTIPSAGILHLVVDSLTTLSYVRMMKVFQELGKCVLHVDMATLVSKADDILAMWFSNCVHNLLIDCSTNPDRNISHICDKINSVFELEDTTKLVVVISRKDHVLNLKLSRIKCRKEIKENFAWENLAETTQNLLLSSDTLISLQGKSISLQDILTIDKKCLDRIDPEIMSQLMLRNARCGKEIEESNELDFIPRRVQARNGAVLDMDAVQGDSRSIVLIVAEPGMGKTTLMTHLAKAATAKSNNSLSWVLLLKLNDCTKELKEFNTEDTSREKVKEFIEKFVLTSGNALERLLYMSLENNLQVFIDGVDEVCPDYKDKIVALLRGLTANVKLKKLYVALRPILQREIEQVLGVDALPLEHFSREDQRNFFNAAWKRKQSSISEEQSDRFTESLLNLVSSTLHDTNPILGVPLMAEMLKEIFEDRLRKFVEKDELDIPVKLDILSLYDEFVNKKYDIYMKEKKKMTERDLSAVLDDEKPIFEIFLQNHKEASLPAIFGDKFKEFEMDEKGEFLKRQAEFLKKVSEGKVKVGIIDVVKENIPHFVHQTFAEYFAACWFADNYQKNRKIMEIIMFTPKFKMISEMFNRLLARSTTLKIHNMVLNRETSKILECSETTVSDDLDAGGRSPLHLAVYQYGIENHKDYIAIVQALLQRNCKTDNADNVLGWVPLKYADRFKSWTIAGLILAAGGDVADMPSLQSIREETREQFIDFIKLDSPDLSDLRKPEDSLMLAAAKDACLGVIRYLVEERNGNPGCRGPLGETMAHKAAEGGDADLLSYLVSEDKTLLEPDDEQSNPLHYAALADNVETIRFLDKEGLDKNAKNTSGETPLLVSATQGTNLNVLAALAEISDVNAGNREGNTSLQILARRGNYEAMTILINHESLIETDASKLTVEQVKVNFLCAAYAGDLSKVRVFMESDINLDGTLLDFADDKGNTAIDVALIGRHREVIEHFLLTFDKEPGDSLLHIASRIGKHKIISFLMIRDTNVDAVNELGKTSLHVASECRQPKAVKSLIECGAEYKADLRGSFPLHSAIHADGPHTDIVTLLVNEFVVNLDARDSLGRTALALASENGHLELVKILDKGGASMLEDNEGNTPLHLASLNGHGEVVMYLAEHVVDVNVKNVAGKTPMFLAAEGDQEDAMECLFLFGAEMTADESGSTPMHVAARLGNQLALECLIKHGAKVDSLNNSHQTPIILAQSNGHFKVVETLLNNGAAMTI